MKSLLGFVALLLVFAGGVWATGLLIPVPSKPAAAAVAAVWSKHDSFDCKVLNAATFHARVAPSTQMIARCDLAFTLDEPVFASPPHPELAGIRVFIDGYTAPISRVTRNEVTFYVPPSLRAPNAAATFGIVRGDANLFNGTVPVMESSPGLFSAQAGKDGGAAIGYLLGSRGSRTLLTDGRGAPVAIPLKTRGQKVLLLATGLLGPENIGKMKLRFGESEVSVQKLYDLGDGTSWVEAPIPTGPRRGEVRVQLECGAVLSNIVAVTFK